ncbi:MAG: DUF362 domain-containing protein [Desulfosarcina sp.]
MNRCNQPVAGDVFSGYAQTVARCMQAAGAGAVLDGKRPVMLKPNLVNDSPHPVTTPPAFCEAVITSVRQYTTAPIVIGEGCGDAHLETSEVFARLGYQDLARRQQVALVDLNRSTLVRCENADCQVFPEMWLPEAVFEHVLISLPVLKAHSLCRFSGSMKNMLGLAPPSHYSGRFGTWKKAAFHHRLDEAIVDLNRYRGPDFTVMDATIGLADFHLGGPQCNPPVNRILAGADARALDREAAGLLGLDWTCVGHLK